MSRKRFNEANVRPVLDLIDAQIRQARFDILKAELEGTHAMRFSFSSGTHRAQLMGVTGTGAMGERDAVDSWARAARRRLLRENG